MKKKIMPMPVEYKEPDRYEGQCTLCGKVNQTYDYANTMKASAFGNLWCRCVRNATTHTNVRKVK